MSSSSAWFHEAPLVIAHRGASARAPENTLEAFRLAGELGADAVELDAKLSADGQVIVFHDRTLQRITGDPARPNEKTFDELRRLDAGAWKGERFRGSRIPSLDEVLAEVGHRLLVNIELTNYQSPDDDLAARAVSVVRAHGMEPRVLFSSFFRRTLQRVKGLAPDIPCGRLVAPTPYTFRDLVSGPPVRVEALNPYHAMMNRWIVNRIHRRGQRVFVFTVNDPARLRAVWRMEVDGVITDDPETARQELVHAG